MKALMYYGPNDLRVTEVSEPVPLKNEALIKVRACGICGSDVHGYLGITGRRIAPMVMGHEFSGEIVRFGEGTVCDYKIGDRVTVQPVDFCGECENCKSGYTNVCLNKRFFGVMDVNGAFEEYLAVPVKLLYKLPDNISFDEGALIEPLAVAYCGVKKAGDITGKNVLIVGGGTIGQMVLSVVKARNAKNIIVSDLSEFRLNMAKKLGATHVINPKDKNIDEFQRDIQNILDGKLVDVAFEAVGIGPTVTQALSSLRTQGTCIWVGNSAKMIELNMQYVVTKELKIFGTYIYTHEEFGETIDFLSEANLNLNTLISKEIVLEQAPTMFAELVKTTDKYLKVVVKFE
ncbi:MAG: (R,R)-butanediol dehydrogenase / meso-butanediol dehydrogenase / diacetyl reductase [Clostridiales bacterium]|nr:(R,R)-butanediol dehydrogenase / meso-butanediol dehydrogenase / diacetyl reductase [Clostridiales bacterium]